MQIMRPARALASVPVVITLVLVSFAFAQSKPQAAAPCKAYFTVLQSGDPNAQVLVELNKPQPGLTVFQSSAVNAQVMVGLNRPQSIWYQKNGSKKQFAGICLWNMPDERITAQELVSRIDKLSAPLYAMAWAESLRTEVYEVDQLRLGQTSDNLPTSTPRTFSRTIRYGKADGVLARWDAVSHALVGLKSLQKSSVFGSIPGPDRPASVLLLEDGLEAIRKNVEQRDLR